jgi:hypothetical protein
MFTKLIGACAALAALAAFAIAPALSAAQTVVDTEGGVEKTVEVGKKIVAYSEGTSVIESPGGLKFECNENLITGTITRNEKGKGIQWTIEDVWFQGNLTTENTHCQSNSGPTTVTFNTTNGPLEPKTHWCFETIQGTDKFKIEPHNCGGKGGAFTFGYDFGGLNCGFTRTVNIEGTFKTGSDVGGVVTPATLTIGAEGETVISFTTDNIPGHSILCPASLTTRNLTFKIYTDLGETSGKYSQTVDTESPVWIKTD